MNDQQKINPADLVCMDDQASVYDYRIDLAYAQNDNLLLGEAVYHADAKLWLHTILAEIVFKAAKTLEEQGYRLILYDGLRTTDAQALMLRSQRVIDNPQWLEEPRLLSPPGTGAHPRGMAIDVSIEMKNGMPVDMGTAFDFLAPDPSPDMNPAHRQHSISDDIKHNRGILDHAMLDAARSHNQELFLLPQEWWDFRLPPSVYEAYAPISDADLPPEMRVVL